MSDCVCLGVVHVRIVMPSASVRVCQMFFGCGYAEYIKCTALVFNRPEPAVPSGHGNAIQDAGSDRCAGILFCAKLFPQ